MSLSWPRASYYSGGRRWLPLVPQSTRLLWWFEVKPNATSHCGSWLRITCLWFLFKMRILYQLTALWVCCYHIYYISSLLTRNLLIRIHCQPSWEDGKFVICEKFADDLWYQCESAGSYNIDSCVTNEELGFTRDSYIEHILGQNFTIHKPSDAKNPGSECFNSSSQTIVSLALLFVAAIVAILFWTRFVNLRSNKTHGAILAAWGVLLLEFLRTSIPPTPVHISRLFPSQQHHV